MDFNESTKTIPRTIRSETMLGKGIFLTDVAIIVACYFLLDNFKDFVHPLLQVFYTVFTIVLGFVITRKTKSNPGKRVLSSIVFYWNKDKKTYHRKEIRPEPPRMHYVRLDRISRLMKQDQQD